MLGKDGVMPDVPPLAIYLAEKEKVRKNNSKDHQNMSGLKGTLAREE